LAQIYCQQSARQPGDIISERRATSSRNQRATSSESAQYLSDLEQGRRNPTIVSLYEVATALGVSHMELVRSAEDE
jgi:transcriptional regulator with XRE-family HTH domain